MDSFLTRVEKTADCWLWRGSVNSGGYGFLRWDGVGWSAHRAAYTRYLGPIAPGQEVRQRCRNRVCVYPAHLFLASPSQRIRETIAQGRSNNFNAAKTHCKRGHLLAGENLLASPGSYPAGQRGCRACFNEKCRERYARRHGPA